MSKISKELRAEFEATGWLHIYIRNIETDEIAATFRVTRYTARDEERSRHHCERITHNLNLWIYYLDDSVLEAYREWYEEHREVEQAA